MKKIVPIIFILFMILLTGCSKTIEKEYYMLMSGESESWELTNYQVKITADTFKAGNGKLAMKDTDIYPTNSFTVEAHAVIGSKDEVISSFHSSGYTGDGINIARETTGGIEGGNYKDEEGNPITMEDINHIYVTVKWWDPDLEKDVQERIDLYDGSSGFFNGEDQN